MVHYGSDWQVRGVPQTGGESADNVIQGGQGPGDERRGGQGREERVRKERKRRKQDGWK